MNCFQLIKSVLDEVYNEIPGREAAKDREITNRLEYLRDKYRKLLVDSSPIDYSDPVTRFAYIYRYVTCHANLVYQLINSLEPLSVLFDLDKLTVTCIGGGPGSDFLGILKYMMNNKKSTTLRCILYDREEAWGETWSDVDEKVEAGFNISTYFQQFDITETTTWSSRTKYLQSSIFTMIYFVSEVYAVRDQATAFFEHLFQKSRDGALFLFVDNNSEAFYQWFDALAAAAELALLEEGSGCMSLPSDEEKTDLGVYFTKFSLPKLNPDIAYRVYMKA